MQITKISEVHFSNWKDNTANWREVLYVQLSKHSCLDGGDLETSTVEGMDATIEETGTMVAPRMSDTLAMGEAPSQVCFIWICIWMQG